MDKIFFFVSSNKKKNVLDGLSRKGFDIEKLDIHEEKRLSFLGIKIRAFSDWLKTCLQCFVQDLKSIMKTGRIEVRFGGAGYDYEFAYTIGRFILFAFISGATWDVFKKIVKGGYKYLKTRRVRYIALVSDRRMPADTLVYILIPNNLKDKELGRILDEAENISNSIDPVRNYFPYRKILIKHKKYWRIRFKGKRLPVWS